MKVGDLVAFCGWVGIVVSIPMTFTDDDEAIILWNDRPKPVPHTIGLLESISESR